MKSNLVSCYTRSYVRPSLNMHNSTWINIKQWIVGYRGRRKAETFGPRSALCSSEGARYMVAMGKTAAFDERRFPLPKSGPDTWQYLKDSQVTKAGWGIRREANVTKRTNEYLCKAHNWMGSPESYKISPQRQNQCYTPKFKDVLCLTRMVNSQITGWCQK
jgi:hypothetical protein